jgi:hypothetical protein
MRVSELSRALIHGPIRSAIHDRDRRHIHVLLNGGRDLDLTDRIKAAEFSVNAQSRRPALVSALLVLSLPLPYCWFFKS